MSAGCVDIQELLYLSEVLQKESVRLKVYSLDVKTKERYKVKITPKLLA